MARFSDEELYEFRNKISLLSLLQFLGVETKLDGEILIFSCPSCGGYRTGINPKANMCRCFYCDRNFNPIELVMAQRKCTFVESVKFLKQHFDKLAQAPVLATHCESQKKISAPNTSSDGRLSALELQLVALATPKKSQCLLERSV